MSKQDLIKLVDNYQEGYFNPYQFAPEQEQTNLSNEDEEEEEMSGHSKWHNINNSFQVRLPQ